jgi:hypothetical protein
LENLCRIDETRVPGFVIRILQSAQEKLENHHQNPAQEQSDKNKH